VEAIVAACANKSAGCVVNEIFKAVTEHAAGVDTFDDQTVVAIKVKTSSGKRK
jgi:serine phosphatase RsbU (regulator of sigma subunit)